MPATSRKQRAAHHACELCRQRKRKCNSDGTSPCKECHAAGTECVYLATPRISKADLRKELARLQSVNLQSDTLLNAISSQDTGSKDLRNILRQLYDGQSCTEGATMLAQKTNNCDSASRENSSNLSTPAPSSASSNSPGILLLNTQEGSLGSIPSETSTFAATTSPLAASFRTNLPLYRLQLPKLLDSILASDFLSFCPLSEEDAMQNLEFVSGQYNSTALIDSLLALATLLEQDVIKPIMPQPASIENLGDFLAQEAIAALYNGNGLPLQTADIQALGILSIYCFGRGKMKDGQGFAGDFGAAIVEQWCTEQPLQPEAISSAARQTRANIYCAAISFNRMLFLINDYNKTLEEVAVRVGVDVVISEGPGGTSPSACANLSGSIIDDAFFTKDLTLLPNNPRVIAAKLFELTELVYKTRYHMAESSFNQVVRAYKDSMRWYESFFAYTNSCDCNMPLELFSHTYYQFCILCLLTPYVTEPIPLASDGTLPMAVCRQAADSIEQLEQHHRELCKDRRMLVFMPLFKSSGRSFLQIFESTAQV